MTLLKIWRRMLMKPLPRALFGYIFGSIVVSLLIYCFAPFPLFWKQVISGLLIVPYSVGIPVIECCLLYRERRVKWFIKTLWKVVPIFVLMNAVNFFLSPKYFWTVFPVCAFTMFSSLLYGSWARRMIKLGYFGDVIEDAA